MNIATRLRESENSACGSAWASIKGDTSFRNKVVLNLGLTATNYSFRIFTRKERQTAQRTIVAA